MSNKNKHWYNNGIEARMFYEDSVPDGFVRGNLRLSKEALERRNEKFKATFNKKSEDEILIYRLHLSEGSKGKNRGKEPWNKGTLGALIAWNKGLKGLHTRSDSAKIKSCQTMRERGTFNTSKPEEDYYQYLLSIYKEDDIIRQYRSELYPFNCDFYILSEDLYIECNYSWTHGPHPFNEDSEEDRQLLELWKDKSKTSNYYKNAIYTWTDLDVKKLKIAKENNLNYQIIY